MSATKRPAVSAPKRTQVLIVDDHPVVRQGLSQLINQAVDLQVCGEIDSAPQVVDAIKTHHPDIVVTDLSLEGSSGLDVIEAIKASFPKLPVLVLSMHDETLYAERVLKAGAHGYAMKETPVPALLAAIRRVAAGDMYLSEKMSGRLLQKAVLGVPVRVTTPEDMLTNRELQVFELIGQGLGTREIATQLHLSSKTIDTHRENIKRKLNLENTTELHQHAFSWAQRLTSLPRP